MKIAEVLCDLAANQVKLWEEGGALRYRAPAGVMTGDIKQFLSSHKQEVLERLRADGISDTRSPGAEESRFESFPLTALQEAYWVGEKDFYGLRSPAYFYEEYETDHLDLDRLQGAVDKLVLRHDMLRARISNDGMQQVIDDCSLRSYDIPCVDISNLSENETIKALAAAREEFMHLPAADVWPLFRIYVHRLSSGFCVHFTGRLLIGDGWSWTLFLKELAEFYNCPSKPVVRPGASFRDYVGYIGRLRKTATYKSAEDYWRKRIENLPGTPQLRFVDTVSGSKRHPMVRRSLRLDAQEWTKFKDHARNRGITPDAILCTVLAEVLSLWSRTAHFSFAVMFANRPNIHPDIAEIFGNFSTTLLLEADFRTKASIETHARTLQRQMLKDLQFSVVPGVEVARMIQQSQGGISESLPASIVFASMLNVGGKTEAEALKSLGWRKIYNAVGTPQVLLDNQVFEDDGELQINWDCVEERFGQGTLAAMWGAFTEIMKALASDDASWGKPAYALFSKPYLVVRKRINSTDQLQPSCRLHEPFMAIAKTSPLSIALQGMEENVTYGLLYDLAYDLCIRLKTAGIRPGELVAISAAKGTAQIIGVIGVLLAGGVYVPVNPHAPPERMKELIGECEFRFAIVGEAKDATIFEINGVTSIFARVPEARNFTEISREHEDGLAYIIFTSGSTGKPKGVMITHYAAYNTVYDINNRFGLGASDKILAVSELSFDLSVFDIFGALSAGASIVFPEHTSFADPEHLVNRIHDAAVTVINCVPALMELLVEYAESQGLRFDTLRLVMLSGDWIPVTLPGRIRALSSARIIGLGGATEASIWSNWYEIEKIPESWRSIPYGSPLANQSMYVLNEQFEHCPDYVPGQIYIGGKGLASGYFKDPKKSESAFVTHPDTGERLYRTGDWGLCWADGTIEFLGRFDLQVKIRGYRVELGEIEATLNLHPDVDTALVVAQGKTAVSKRLVAYIKPTDGKKPEAAELIDFVRNFLPGYMIPSQWHTIERIPLTRNGKVDRAALRSADGDEQAFETPRRPLTETESVLKAIWREIGIDAYSVDADFLGIGGNSLLAVRMFNEIERRMGLRLPLSSLFEFDTIAKLAKRIEKAGVVSWRHNLVPMRIRESRPLLVFVHPIGGGLLCYSALVAELADTYSIYGLQCAESGKNEPRKTIREMALSYVEALSEIVGTEAVRLCGWSMGGMIAYEMCAELRRHGKKTSLVMIDPWVAGAPARGSEDCSFSDFMADLAASTDGHNAHINDDAREKLDVGSLERYFEIYKDNRHALRHYQSSDENDVDLFIVYAADEDERLNKELVRFRPPSCRGSHSSITLSGNHYSVLKPPMVKELAGYINRAFSGGVLADDL